MGVIWHYDVQSSTGCALRYFFVEISPTYERDVIFKELEALLRKHEVNTFELYEVYGPVDVILKAWVPYGQIQALGDALQKWRSDDERGFSTRSRDVVSVERCWHHWLWPNDEKPGQNALKAISSGDFPDISEPNALEKCKADFLLGEREALTPRIRIISSISVSMDRVPPKVMEGHVKSVIGGILELDGVINPEIYTCEGHNWILIDAAVEYKNYLTLLALHTAISTTSLRDYMPKTTSYLCSDNISGVLGCEEMPTKDDEFTFGDEKWTELVFERDEGGFVEHKGSLSVQLYEYFGTGATTSSPKLVQAVLKTITAFLNSDGGILCIGTIEPDKFPKHQEQVEKLSSIGRYRVVGIEAETDKGFDHFSRHLVDKVRTAIGTDAANKISIREYPVGDRTLCIVTVKRSRSSQYLNQNEYWVRQGAASVRLEGSAQENYQTDRKEERS